jgi:hypothetical protein
MAAKNRGAPAKMRPTPHPSQGQVQPKVIADAPRGTLSDPVPGERYEYPCQICEHEADATYRIDKYTGQLRWFVGSAYTNRCPRGPACLALLAEWLGVEPKELLSDPRPALIAAGGKGRRQDDSAPRRPSLGQIGGWHSRLMEQQNARVLDYLLGRGVSLEVVQRCRIGWDGRYLTFPMRGRFLKRREPRDGAQMLNLPGKDRPWPLYPRVPRDKGWALLVAGELDALCALSAGLPAVSVTLGASAWRDAWTDELCGLSVVVCFDNNEHDLAARRVRELRAAGVNACGRDLRALGLDKPKGDLSDYLNAGGDPDRLVPPGRRTR